MDKPKVVVKKKKIKKKPKSKAKTATQMQTQKVIVNLSDVLKPKSKSRKRTSTSTKTKQEPQIIYQPAPLPLQPDLQNIIRSELSKVNSRHEQLTPSKIEQAVNNLVPVLTPEPALVRTEPPIMKTIANFQPVGERPIILEPPDEEPVLVKTEPPAKEKMILLMKPADLKPIYEPDPELQIEKGKRGRPLGAKQSAETKARISESLVKTKAFLKEVEGTKLTKKEKKALAKQREIERQLQASEY